MFICSYFLCLHADIADALTITYLAEEHLQELDAGYEERAPRVRDVSMVGIKERSGNHGKDPSFIVYKCLLS